MRHFRDRVVSELAQETSVRYWAGLGVWWVVSAGAVASLTVPSSGSSAAARLPFYAIAASLMPVLLSAFLLERRVVLRSHAEQTRRLQALSERVAEAGVPDEELQRLTERSRRVLRARIACSALIPASAITAELIALFVVATGASTTFSYMGVMLGLLLAGMGAVFETADAFGRLAEPTGKASLGRTG